MSPICLLALFLVLSDGVLVANLGPVFLTVPFYVGSGIGLLAGVVFAPPHPVQYIATASLHAGCALAIAIGCGESHVWLTLMLVLMTMHWLPYTHPTVLSRWWVAPIPPVLCIASHFMILNRLIRGGQLSDAPALMVPLLASTVLSAFLAIVMHTQQKNSNLKPDGTWWPRNNGHYNMRWAQPSEEHYMLYM